jgi:HEAT repeat protein
MSIPRTTSPELRRIAGLLGEVIRTGSKWDRIVAADACGRLVWHASDVVPALVELMEADPDARQVAVQAIGRIGPPAAADAIPALTSIVGTPGIKDHAREEAAKALGRTMDERAVGPLVEALGREPPGSDLRQQIIASLGKLGAVAAEAVPLLIPMLRLDDGLAHAVVVTLGAIGTGASAAVPHLKSMRSEVQGDDDLTRSIDDAIEEIDGRG